MKKILIIIKMIQKLFPHDAKETRNPDHIIEITAEVTEKYHEQNIFFRNRFYF